MKLNLSPNARDHLSRALKIVALTVLTGLIFALCSCANKRTPMVTTTTTRATPGLFGGASGTETTTVTRPYDPFGEGAAEAGKLMFSQP